MREGEAGTELGVPRVLVVDDDAEMRAMVRKMLGKWYDVREAGDGAEALALLAAEGADLVILDVTMPGMNGWEVCQRIKSDPATQAIPVLMLSVRSQVRDDLEMERARPDAFLNKPFDRADLFGKVVQCLGNR
jgi:CheY-like chemotaxis protein